MMSAAFVASVLAYDAQLNETTCFRWRHSHETRSREAVDTNAARLKQNKPKKKRNGSWCVDFRVEEDSQDARIGH